MQELEESDMFEKQSSDQSALKKLTEDLPRAKKVWRKKKGSGGERSWKY